MPRSTVVWAQALVLIALLGVFLSIFTPETSPASILFRSKHNWLNVYFVKFGWAWTSIAFAYTLPALSNTSSVSRALKRYAIATAYWFFLTQWFLGPSVLDRVFVHSGGLCRPVTEGTDTSEGLEPSLNHPAWHSFVTSRECKTAGGIWSGGHDVSGHAMILAHSILFLVHEVQGIRGKPYTVILSICFLWSWMLLTTTVWFHPWAEIFTGLLCGLGFGLSMNLWGWEALGMGRQMNQD
ncbi:MAG: inositol phospholipid synthesis and fat-storage-inducing TM-domain-containing protein [Piptocephalis tieghemiana]|nr:MAG: inositol phospholipid synthesis and fat-storage-inducing TM-domain-containing protein [Piptocephalis tieghemiana]